MEGRWISVGARGEWTRAACERRGGTEDREGGGEDGRKTPAQARGGSAFSLGIGRETHTFFSLPHIQPSAFCPILWSGGGVELSLPSPCSPRHRGKSNACTAPNH